MTPESVASTGTEPALRLTSGRRRGDVPPGRGGLIRTVTLIAALALPLGIPAAVTAHEFPCDDGIDNDADGTVDCEDTDCSLQAHCQESDCLDGLDNNGNGLIDCFDPSCWSEPHCIPESCTNGMDDDGDGDVDCDDDECIRHPNCDPEDCDNGIDDNGDNRIDCADPTCFGEPACIPEICDNSVDDDGDGDVDCDDDECASEPRCQPENCLNGVDDNANGDVDCDDDECEFFPDCITEICGNGLDDDADGDVDCQDADCVLDPICASLDWDGDGTPNDVDCLPRDPTAARTPVFSPTSLFVTKLDEDAVLTWEDLGPSAGSGTRYDVLRGRLFEDLWSNGRLGFERCIADNEPLTLIRDLLPDQSGERSFYYVVRGQNDCPAGAGTGSYDHAILASVPCD